MDASIYNQIVQPVHILYTTIYPVCNTYLSMLILGSNNVFGASDICGTGKYGRGVKPNIKPSCLFPSRSATSAINEQYDYMCIGIYIVYIDI